MVPGAGIEPARGLPPKGFSYHYGFRRCSRIRGLDFIFAVTCLRTL